MATQIVHNSQGISKPAGATGINAFYVVKLDAAGNVIPIASTSDVPYGVAIYTPSAVGQPVHVVKTGIVKAVAGAAITIGANLSFDATGRVIVATTGRPIIGRSAKAASAAGVVVQVEVNLLSGNVTAP